MDRVVSRLGHTRCEHVDAAVRTVGRLKCTDPVLVEIGVACARLALEQGLASASAVQSGEAMIKALEGAENVIPMRRRLSNENRA